MAQRPSKADYVVLAELRREIRRFLRYSEESAREVGITPQQHQIILALKGNASRDWMSIAELADSLQLKHHTVVGLVDRSVLAGLVEREPDSEDKRQVRISLTNHGEEIVEKLSRKNLEELNQLKELVKGNSTPN